MKINRFSHEIANNAHLMYICIYIQPLKGCHAWLNLVVYWLCRWFTSIWIKRTFTKKWNLYLTWGIYIPQMMSICFARNLNDQIAIQISKWQYQRWLICDVTLATGNIHSSEESDNVMITKKSQTSRFWDF